MKNSHTKTIPLIRQAINACGEDDRMIPIKQLLHKALIACCDVAKKRNHRESVIAQYAQEAQKKESQWQEILRQGLLKQLPEVESHEKTTVNEFEKNE